MSKIVAGTVIAIMVVAALLWWFALRDEPVETITVSRGSIDVTIQTIGRVQSTGSTTVRAQAAGEVETLAVAAGDFVVEGDVLVQLVDEPFERARMDAVRGVENAEFGLQRAQQEADENPDDEDLTFAVIQAAQRVEDAERALTDANDALAQTVILAPRAGIVLETSVDPGDLVNNSLPVATLFHRDDLEIVADVDELDLVNVEQGGVATVRLDAYPSEEIDGSVVSTSPAAREQGGATVFSTIIAITVPDSLDIRPGMNADVTIVTDARDSALLIPQQAIRTVGERAFVSLIVDGDEVEREVLLGYRSGGQVEVVSGLSEGDRIALQ